MIVAGSFVKTIGSNAVYEYTNIWFLLKIWFERSVMKRIGLWAVVLMGCYPALFALRKSEGSSQQPIYQVIAETKVSEMSFLPNETEEARAKSKKERYAMLLSKYEGCEAHFKEYGKYMEEASLESLWGGINYSMTLDDMRKKVKEKFQNLKNSGLIISKKDFGKAKDQYYDKPSDNLTRIWGADYIRQQLQEKKWEDRYGVPDYIIVVDDPHAIQVVLNFTQERWPTVSLLLNGDIYFKKIVGKGVGNNSMDLTEIHYVDVGSSEDKKHNVLQTATGKRYIVDTEFKSFGIPLPESRNFRECLSYFHERFKHVNGVGDNEKYTFTLD